MEQLSEPAPLSEEEEAQILEELREAWESLLEQVAAEIETPEGAYGEDS